MALLADDRRAARRALAQALGKRGFLVLEASGCSDGWQHFAREAPDVVMAHLALPEEGGLSLLARIRAGSRAPVILFAEKGAASDAVAALKQGADNFALESEIGRHGLAELAARCVAQPAAAADLAQLAQALPGKSALIRRVHQRLAALAPLSAPVLLCGERGAGRGAAARALHNLSRPQRPFVELHAAQLQALPVLPRGATACLRGVQHLAPPLQRALRERLLANNASGANGANGASGADGAPRWIFCGGPGGFRHADARDLDRALAAQLRRFQVHLPALRERPEDVAASAHALAAQSARSLGRPACSLSDDAVALLSIEPWHGNLAELGAVIERMVAFSTRPEIGWREAEEALNEMHLSVESLRINRQQQEREKLLGALRQTGGNVTRSAQLLGCSRTAIYRMVERHGVPLRR